MADHGHDAPSHGPEQHGHAEKGHGNSKGISRRDFLKALIVFAFKGSQAAADFVRKNGASIVEDLPFAAKNAFGAGEASKPGGGGGHGGGGHGGGGHGGHH